MITKWEVETFQSGPLGRIVAKKSDHVKYKVQPSAGPTENAVLHKIERLYHRPSISSFFAKKNAINLLSLSLYIYMRKRFSAL